MANQFMKLLRGKPIEVSVVNLGKDLQTDERWRFPNLIGRVTEREIEECVDLIQANLQNAMLMQNATQLRNLCLERIPKSGLLLEFGVYRARSINESADHLQKIGDQRLLHGFDSFEGLSHDGNGWMWQKGRFNQNGRLPRVRNNIRLHKGWIDDTLPVFLEAHSGETIAFMHVDIDIYEPAKTILELTKEHLQPGSIIVFDELLGYAGWKNHEFKALNEVFSPEEYEFIGFSNYFQAAIRIR